MSNLEAFRIETREWLQANAPAGVFGIVQDELNGVWGGTKCEFGHPDQKIWLERMGAKGWTAPTWSTEYGGGGLSKEEATVL